MTTERNYKGCRLCDAFEVLIVELLDHSEKLQIKAYATQDIEERENLFSQNSALTKAAMQITQLYLSNFRLCPACIRHLDESPLVYDKLNPVKYRHHKTYEQLKEAGIDALLNVMVLLQIMKHFLLGTQRISKITHLLTMN